MIACMLISIHIGFAIALYSTCGHTVWVCSASIYPIIVSLFIIHRIICFVKSSYYRIINSWKEAINTIKIKGE